MSLVASARRPLVLVTAVVAATTLLIACGTQAEPVLAGYERDPDPTVGQLSIPAVNRGGEDFYFRADPGELLMVYFGFTSCPDFCPTTLADTRIALSLLEDRADLIDVAFVTVDPTRDSDEVVTNYAESFIEGAIALRTDDEDRLRQAAFGFGADYRIEIDDEGEIDVGHTTTQFLVDDSGSLILTWPFGVTPDDIASDLNILLDR